MNHSLKIRLALVAERQVFEALQMRASLNNRGDRDALLANPNAIELPEAQIASGQVFVAEKDGSILGFAAVLDRADGNSELDGLFVEPSLWRAGIGCALVDFCTEYARNQSATFFTCDWKPSCQEIL